MRNKENFITDFEKVVKPEFKKVIDPVQDAAHVINHEDGFKYTLPKDFSSTGKDEVFVFVEEERAKTDNPDENMLDLFYKGKE